MANKFWIGGTGTWDSSNTTNWSLTTGPGTPGAAVPTSADIPIFDANSGGGVVTVNLASLNISGLTMGAFTGRLDFSTANTSVTINGTNGQLSLTGTGAGRRIDMGNSSWSFTGANSSIDATTTTGLTFNANGSQILFMGSGATATRTFAGGGLVYNIVTFYGNNGFPVLITGNNTFGTLNIFGKNDIQFNASSAQSITTLNVTGTAALPALIEASSAAVATVSGTGATITWAAIRQLAFTGAPTATNSFDIGSNTGITIVPPTTGGGGSSFIG